MMGLSPAYQVWVPYHGFVGGAPTPPVRPSPIRHSVPPTGRPPPLPSRPSATFLVAGCKAFPGVSLFHVGAFGFEDLCALQNPLPGAPTPAASWSLRVTVLRPPSRTRVLPLCGPCRGPRYCLPVQVRRYHFRHSKKKLRNRAQSFDQLRLEVIVRV